MCRRIHRSRRLHRASDHQEPHVIIRADASFALFLSQFSAALALNRSLFISSTLFGIAVSAPGVVSIIPCAGGGYYIFLACCLNQNLVCKELNSLKSIRLPYLVNSAGPSAACNSM